MTDDVDDEIKERLGKMSATDILKLLKEKKDADREEQEDGFYRKISGVSNAQQQDSNKQESDVISAKAQHQGLRIGHAPETLRDTDFPGISENDRADIRLRHGKIPGNVVSNIALIAMMGKKVEHTNRILYESNEIDLPQYWRNMDAEIFAKAAEGTVVNALSAIEGERQSSLEKNLMSGKLAHEQFTAEAKDKREGRLSRLRRAVAGEKD